MIGLPCPTARLWLQAPHELSASETSVLHAHLSECGMCSAFSARQTQLDATLTATLEGLQIAPVARSVRARLEAKPVRRPIHARLLPPACLVAPLAVAAMLLALIFPQVLPDGSGSPPAHAAWHLVRPKIGYPLAVDPVRPNHLLAGAFGQVYESRDGGEPWTRLAPLPPHLVIRALAIDTSNPNRYLVATEHSIFLSRDAGRHWTAAVGSLPGAMNMFLTQDPRAPTTFYVGPSILWKSVNGGTSWARDGRGMVFAPDGIQSVQFGSNGTLLAGIWHGGVALSSDGGVTWQRRAQGLAPNVMDVEPGRGADLWAATDRGVYRSTDTGLHWHRSGLPGDFFATSLLVQGRVMLAGGDQALYRSADGGAHWSLAMEGLPLDPYVSGLSGDPFHSQRVYASLNSDGIFRSDDGGRHWRAVDQGLPLQGALQPARQFLFRREGALWISDAAGTDPGVLTVDRNVRLAALSPDQAAVAYVGGTQHRWGAYVLNAGGSAARTILTGAGRPPSAVLWSPSASLLALVRRSRVTVTNLSRASTWPLRPAARVLGWTPDGRYLLTWDRTTGLVAAHLPQTGIVQGPTRGPYPSAPLVAPDGTHIALRTGAMVDAGTWRTSFQAMPSLASCRPIAWSADSTRLLAGCRGSSIEVSPSGTVLVRVHLPPPVRWLPGGHDLLFFRHGNLWKWSPRGAHELIRWADPVSARR